MIHPTARTVRRGVEPGCSAGRMQLEFHRGLLSGVCAGDQGRGSSLLAMANLMSYLVLRRTSEIGLRMALGHGRRACRG
jgi:hypothetical protein